jgi:hypothetical protein
MRIDSVHSHSHVAPHSTKAPKPAASVDAASIVEPSPTAVATEQVDDAPQARGVMRLLDEGHFKGVAELRHRIHHFEMLAAEAKASAGDSLATPLTALTQSLSDQLGAAAADPSMNPSAAEAIGELKSEFELVMQGIAASAADVDFADMRDSLELAFAGLVEKLAAALAAPIQAEEDAVAISVPVVDKAQLTLKEPDLTSIDADTAFPPPEEKAGLDIDGLVASLTDAFRAGLSDLTSTYTVAASLPDPAPAPGKGKAYAKFLAVYNELRTATNQPTLNSVG